MHRAKVIEVEGTMQTSGKLLSAVATLVKAPLAMPSRYLPMLTEAAADRHAAIVSPSPLALIAPLLAGTRRRD